MLKGGNAEMLKLKNRALRSISQRPLLSCRSHASHRGGIVFSLISAFPPLRAALFPPFKFQPFSFYPTMARRASSSLNPGIILGAAAAIAVAIFAGKSLLGKKSSPFGDVSHLGHRRVARKRQQPPRQRIYRAKARSTKNSSGPPTAASWSACASTTPGGDEFIGIEIPPEFNNSTSTPNRNMPSG